jgi:hypothetical protein
VDSNGRWWDETYALCRSAPIVHLKSSAKFDGEQNGSQDRQLLGFIQNNPPPQPRSFSSYKDYEMALVRWKEAMEAALRNAEIMLPTPQGRYHYRPPFNPQCASSTHSSS